MIWPAREAGAIGVLIFSHVEDPGAGFLASDQAELAYVTSSVFRVASIPQPASFIGCEQACLRTGSLLSQGAQSSHNTAIMKTYVTELDIPVDYVVFATESVGGVLGLRCCGHVSVSSCQLLEHGARETRERSAKNAGNTRRRE